MEWMEALNQSIDFMENHLLDNISADDVAESVHMSSYYYQKAFKILTDYTVGEYIRNRRLSLAGRELMLDNVKIIDLAYKYGYETPESFSKAFSRFHGISPVQAKRQSFKLKFFQPLLIKMKVEGGTKMDCRMEKKEAFQVIGIGRKFNCETSYAEIPKFWGEFCQQNCNEEEMSNIGMYGICIEGEDKESGDFEYLIAGSYEGGKIPEGFKTVEIPEFTWAVFPCVGPMPGSLQAVNTRIFSEWLPGNPKYEIAAGFNIELYTMGDIHAVDYKSEIWIPVKEK